MSENNNIENSEVTIEKDTEVYKCPNCGANLQFSVNTQKLVCSHCGTVIDFERAISTELVDFVTGSQNAADWGTETTVFRCNNCGATEVLLKTEIAVICPFCNTTNIVETKELSGIKPNSVLPFSISDEQANQNFNNWLKKIWFKPKNFIQTVKVSKMRGVYSPCFVYNSNSFSTYSLHYGKYYYVTVGSGNNRRTERRVRYYRVNGSYAHDFSDLMVEASPFLDQKTADGLRPFAYQQAAVYDKKFLAGFAASHYDKDMKECFNDAKKVMDKTIRARIAQKHNADVVVSLNLSTNFFKTTYRYMLLPVYLSTFKYNNKDYKFFINGTNSKIYGKVPRSPWKISGFVFLILALLILIYLILSNT